MLKHYLKFAIRNFRSNKVVFSGSLATLCLGALCISLLFSYVYNELTMDDFHEHEKDIYMVTMKQSPKSDWSIPFSFEPEKYPEIEHCVGVQFFEDNDTKIKYNENIYTPAGMVVDSTFFKVFDFKLLYGDVTTVLNDKQTIILSEDFCEKLFGDENPIGKTVDLEMRQYQGIHTVQGIVKIPSNSSLTFDYIIPYQQLKLGYGRISLPFFKARPNFNVADFKEKIKASNNKVPNFYPQLTESITSVIGLDDMYFSNDITEVKKRMFFKSGNEKNIQVLIIIMVVILFVSLLNYSNLQIVNTNSVLKNIAISKVNGANKKHIILQKCVETILIILISALLITILYNLLLPRFNAFVGVQLAPPTQQVFMLNAIIISVITVLGMLYPVWVISRFSTIKNIRQLGKSYQKIGGKQVTVVLQYAMAFVLLISAVVVNNQLGLMLSKDLGFNKEGIIKVKLVYEPPLKLDYMSWSPERRKQEQENRLKVPRYVNDQLASYSGIEKISQGRAPINTWPMDWKPKGDGFNFQTVNSLTVKPNYIDVFGLKVTEGRFFEKGIDKQRGNTIVINEAAKKLWGIKEISNTRILNQSWSRPHGNGFEIIGVVKDFNYEHLSSKPKPLILLFFEDPEADYFIKFHKGQEQDGIKFLEALFQKVNPNQTFKYTFLSDDIAALYQKERRLSTIYMVFTIIALVISAIGLFTIALYDTQRRVKEVGVRKVNGATIHEIMFMLNKDFLKWVIIAFLIACPVAYYAMHKWLENFAYKTALSWWVFALAGVFTMVIALLTVSWQTYKAAAQNPVKSLRDE
ncbi:ABC transporter permease [Aestuariibaculum sediminum]|uniref:ABC transporter permease n=1 Tax=Aestuariibaculum sediminum TaxID=2770637 RepID=A0A8J6QAR8_9FLAO|nr:ABC transporter permease [Aestuariibaculum sediminum]MBD0833772.1 ABC transporter permease [Aestuariibaculum sediminum]